MKRYKVNDVYCPYECPFGCTECKFVLGVYRNNKFDFVLLKYLDGWEYEIGMEKDWEGKFEKSLSLQPGTPVNWVLNSKNEFKVIFTGEENDSVDNIIKQINRELNDNSSL